MLDITPWRIVYFALKVVMYVVALLCMLWYYYVTLCNIVVHDTDTISSTELIQSQVDDWYNHKTVKKYVSLIMMNGCD